MQIGTVVVSKAGRDKGRNLVIIENIDEQYVLAVDGELRTLAKPKKKKLRHLHATPHVWAELATLLPAKRVLDADIRKYLSSVTQKQSKDSNQRED